VGDHVDRDLRNVASVSAVCAWCASMYALASLIARTNLSSAGRFAAK